MKVPFVDLSWQTKMVRPQLDAAIANCLDSNAFIQGRHVEVFEQHFAEFAEMDHVIGCGSGTDALYLALKALGVRPGQQVILPTLTFIATAEAVDMLGATPVFVDIEPNTLCMDPRAVAQAITKDTAALLPVHLHGRPAPMAAYEDLAGSHDLHIVADAAQAHGAWLGDAPIGRFGKVSCFSFYPGKNIGAFGDAGACATNDSALARDMKMRRNHGRESKYEHLFSGVNMRMDEIQAAVLSVKLTQLSAWNEKRRHAAHRYLDRLASIDGVHLPLADNDVRSSWHLFVIDIERRDELRSYLQKRGIATGIHYPIPLHRQPAYRDRDLQHPCPVADSKVKRILSLPLFPGITEQQVDFVVDNIASFMST